MVLVMTLLLQGCATHTSPLVHPPAKDDAKDLTPEDENALLVDAVEDDAPMEEADPFEEDPFEEDPFMDEGDFFDEEALIDEFEATPLLLIRDPLAPFNRAMFYVNDKLLLWIIKPVAIGYRTVAPTVVRRGVSNFFDNLKTPIRLINSLLQGKFKGAGSELSRFVVNTTVGVLGFGDPADHWLHLKPSDEDLGQTLGAWGIGNGIYIVWPILGPSTLRDSASLPEYFYLNPIGYVKPTELSIGISAYEKINQASFTIEDYEILKASALDPYTFIRDLYIQSRTKKVHE